MTESKFIVPLSGTCLWCGI